ncbi:MAG: arabinan endo-1,5-alpha-L-arabinosidase [Phycisphaerales bacterium]|nr:MAG: arabinan endo-1,5-alpha-L-arabinosidase [Phycisphaerales bacterium]
MTKSGKIVAVLTAVLLGPAGCQTHRALNEQSVELGEPSEGLLKGAIELHDPAGIIEDEGYLYTFATGDGFRITYMPPGGDEWIAGNRIWPRREMPAWIEELLPGNKGVWAPHAPFPHVIYYSSADDSDGEDQGVIGRMTARGEPPDFTWVDDGKPVLVCDRDDLTEPFAIDPAVFAGDDDSLWLVYGSHWSGIWVVELDPETGHIKDERALREGWKEDNPAFHFVASELGRHNNKPVPEPGFVAGKIEAPYVFRSDQGMYYLFVNWGTCCHGVDSTYEIRVGRSANPYGPYLDKEGKDMREGGGTLFLATEDRFIGPGHANIWTYADSAGALRYIFAYHFYDGKDESKAKMHARELTWDNDMWPVLTDAVFRKKK